MQASITPAIIGAAIVRARRRIAEYLMGVGAISPESATSFTPENHLQRRQFEWMQRRGVVHEVADRYWIDVAAYRAMVEARRQRIMLIYGVLFIVLAIAVTFAYRLHV